MPSTCSISSTAENGAFLGLGLARGTIFVALGSLRSLAVVIVPVVDDGVRQPFARADLDEQRLQQAIAGRIEVDFARLVGDRDGQTSALARIIAHERFLAH